MSENTATARSPFPLVTVGVLIIALAVVFLVGLSVNDEKPDPNTAAAPETQARGIITNGKGAIKSAPDQLTFAASVGNTRGETADALAATNADIRAVTAAATKAGVDVDDIRTADLSVRPRFEYSTSGRRLTGYTSRQRLEIIVRKLDDAGKVIGAVSAAGGNRASIGSVRLSFSNRAALIDQARVQAVERSKEAAEAIARAAGRSVGELEFVQEIDPNAYAAGTGGFQAGTFDLSSVSALKSVPISPGEQTLSVTVQARWSVAPGQ